MHLAKQRHKIPLGILSGDPLNSTQVNSILVTFARTMTPIKLPLLFLVMVAVASAAPLATDLSHSMPRTTQSPATSWSNEAIFTLIGVCLAALTFLIGLLSSPKLRRWLCRPFNCEHFELAGVLLPQDDAANTIATLDFSEIRRIERSQRQNDKRRRMEDEYNEYVRFNEFMELRGRSLDAGHSS